MISSIEGITIRSAEAKTLVDDLSTGSQQQLKGIEEIVGSVHQMEKLVHQVLHSGQNLTLAGNQISAQTTNVENGVARLNVLVEGTHSRQR